MQLTVVSRGRLLMLLITIKLINWKDDQQIILFDKGKSLYATMMRKIRLTDDMH